MKKKIITIIVIVATIILAGVTVYTAIRLYQLRAKPVAPNVPESKPAAAGIVTPTPIAPILCELDFAIPTPTPVEIICSNKKIFKDDTRNTPGAYYLTGNELATGSNVAHGQKLVFSIMPAPANVSASVSITDQLSTNFNFLDSDSSCLYNSATRTVSCSLSTTNSQASFRVVVTNNATGTLTNTASVVSNGKTTTCSTNVIIKSPTPSPTPKPTATPTKSPSPTPKPTATPTKSPSPSPSPTPTIAPVAQCQNITAYSSTWTVLTAQQLSALKSGNVINVCVVGSASAGIFDKAMFTINGAKQAETVTKRPNTQDFCQSYTIPANIYSFDISAQIHHATLGWK